MRARPDEQLAQNQQRRHLLPASCSPRLAINRRRSLFRGLHCFAPCIIRRLNSQCSGSGYVSRRLFRAANVLKRSIGDFEGARQHFLLAFCRHVRQQPALSILHRRAPRAAKLVLALLRRQCGLQSAGCLLNRARFQYLASGGVNLPSPSPSWAFASMHGGQ